MKTPWWFMHKTPLAFILVPVSWVYYLVGRVVYMFRRIGAYKSNRPVICFGNILAGGVGKTPIVRAVAKLLDAPVVMRGYKKSAKTGNIGDEATMLARDGIQVHVGNRKINVMMLDKQLDARGPIIMDDGFQNPRVKKDISVLVFNQSIGYGNGFMLPAGPLREPRWAVHRADAVIVVRSARPRRHFTLPTDIPVFYATTQNISPYDKNQKLYAFAGIGYPKKFFAELDNLVGKKAFADHYQYTDDDLKKLIGAARELGAKLVTTEKDWVRLPQWARSEIKYVRLEMTIDNAFFQWIKEKTDGGNIK